MKVFNCSYFRLLVYLFSVMIHFFSLSPSGHAQVEARHWNFSEFQKIPVLSGGRIKPLDTLAREWVILTTGSKKFEGWQPIEMLVSWLTYPQDWMELAFISVPKENIRKELGLDLLRTRYSPKELIENPILMQYAQGSQQVGVEAQTAQMQGAQNQGMPKPDQQVIERRKVFDRLAVFRGVVDGSLWTVLPPMEQPESLNETPSEKVASWSSLAVPAEAAKGGGFGAGSHGKLRTSFLSLFKNYLERDQSKFESSSSQIRLELEALLLQTATEWKTQGGPDSIEREVFYHRLRPFLWSWILYLLSAMLFLFALKDGIFFRPAEGVTPVVSQLRAAAFLFMCCGFVMHSYGFVLRCLISGRPPVTNMYESVVWVAWGVIIFSLFIYRFQKQSIVLLVGNVVALLCLIISDAAPAVMDPSIHPLVPVLRSNYWLTIHVLTITLGYAAYALSFGLGHFTLLQFLRKTFAQQSLEVRNQLDTKIISTNQLCYRAMQIGTVLLAAGTILGGVWADESWGRFWGWDPKEVWALIALLCYLAILHAKMTGWIGQFGFSAWSVGSFLSVIMAWYGVNFVLGVGLHSYGFSTGGRGPVSIFVLAELVLIFLITIRYKKFKALQSSEARVV